MAAKGITTAGQVALGAAAPVVEQATKPITPESAKETATSAAVGGLLGGAGGQLAKAQPKVAQQAGEIAERRAVKAIGVDIAKPQRRVEKMPGGSQAFGRDLLDKGIVTAGKTIPDMRERSKALAEASGSVIGKTMREFDKQIGSPSVNTDNLMMRINEEVGRIENLASGRKNPSNVAFVQRLRTQWLNEMEKLAEETPVMNLEDLWEVRRDLDRIAQSSSGIDTPIKKSLQGFRAILEDELQQSAKNAGISPKQIAEYQKNKRTYQVSREASEIAAEKMQRDMKNRQISLTDYLTGGAAGTMGATVAGAPGGMAAAVIGAMGNKIARERGPQVAAATLDKLSAMMRSDPELFQKIVSQFLRTGTVMDF
jgi:hypothetical protein